MHLDKWYADVVSGDNVEIHYLAQLTVGCVAIEYRHRLSTKARTPAKARLRRAAMPTISGQVLRWPDAEGRLIGEWQGVTDRKIELWRDDHRLMTWNPMVLNGSFAAAGARPAARGYVERLRMNFGPWQLGLQTLKWGRFCGSRHSLVWIEWAGQQPKMLALLDGQNDTLLAANRTDVVTRRARLTLHEPRAIVSEPIGSGALKALGAIRMLAAQRFLSGVENKWLAHGVLEVDGEAADQGHVVYEEVLWP